MCVLLAVWVMDATPLRAVGTIVRLYSPSNYANHVYLDKVRPSTHCFSAALSHSHPAFQRQNSGGLEVAREAMVKNDLH